MRWDLQPARRPARAAAWATLALVGACGASPARPGEGDERPDAPLPPLPWEASPAEAVAIESPLIALVGGRVMTAAGATHEDGVVLMEDGRILAVGPRGEVRVPAGARVIEVGGRVVTPGIIDTHSHMGVYAQPGVRANSDGNEATSPVTAHVWAGDSVWPQDAALARALASGVTTIQVLPGSANLIGGRGAILKLHLGRTVQEMLFPGAPDTLKMACGENPKRVYGGRDAAPSTRMGNVAETRAAFQAAVEYGRAFRRWQQEHRVHRIEQRRFERFEAERAAREAPQGGGPGARGAGDGRAEDARAGAEGARAGAEGAEGEEGEEEEEEEEEVEDPGPPPAAPDRDFGKEALLGVLEGRVLVQMHCYRADEMARMMEVAREFGFSIRSFHHAVEAYKVRDLLAAGEVSISTWADWWGFKLEAFDAIPENLALLHEAGVRAIVHSDSAELAQHLPQEAAKAMAAGRRAGIDVGEDDALSWVTANPAWALGVHRRTGTLEVGKMADVVVWSGAPFSVYAHADLVFVDGVLRHDRAQAPAVTDFEVGL